MAGADKVGDFGPLPEAMDPQVGKEPTEYQRLRIRMKARAERAKEPGQDNFMIWVDWSDYERTGFDEAGNQIIDKKRYKQRLYSKADYLKTQYPDCRFYVRGWRIWGEYVGPVVT